MAEKRPFFTNPPVPKGPSPIVDINAAVVKSLKENQEKPAHEIGVRVSQDARKATREVKAERREKGIVEAPPVVAVVPQHDASKPQHIGAKTSLTNS